MIAKFRNNNLLNEFFNNSYSPRFVDHSCYYNTPAVNILEEKNEFKIEVAAPGLTKNDFEIELDNYLLTVSSKSENVEPKDNDRFAMREFNYASFKRSFTLPRTVKTDKINASHKDGILTILIPKKEEAIEKPIRQIAIS